MNVKVIQIPVKMEEDVKTLMEATHASVLLDTKEIYVVKVSSIIHVCMWPELLAQSICIVMDFCFPNKFLAF